MQVPAGELGDSLAKPGQGERVEGGAGMASYGWAYFRIMTGTILGGILGFYVMHRVETSYKERMKERLIKYENEMKKREQFQQQEDQSKLLPDS